MALTFPKITSLKYSQLQVKTRHFLRNLNVKDLKTLGLFSCSCQRL